MKKLLILGRSKLKWKKISSLHHAEYSPLISAGLLNLILPLYLPKPSLLGSNSLLPQPSSTNLHSNSASEDTEALTQMSDKGEDFRMLRRDQTVVSFKERMFLSPISAGL